MRSLLEGNEGGAEIVRPRDRAVGVERGGDQGLRTLPQGGRAALDDVVELDGLAADALDREREAELVLKEGRRTEIDLEAHGWQPDAPLPEQSLPRHAHGNPPILDHAVE